MKAFDVHPEELLDREPRGVLTDEQRALLDAHLARCESCRLERLLRADFAAEAMRADEADMQSFVLGALQRAASVEAAASAPAAGSGGSTRRRLSAVLLVACILLMAAGALAARTAWVERIFEATFGAPAKAPRAVRAGKRAVKAQASQTAVVSAPVASEAASVVVAPVALPEALAEAAPDVSRAKTRSAPKLVPGHKNLKRRAPQVAPRSEPQRAAFAVSARSAALAEAAPKPPLAAPVREPEPVVAAKPEPVVDEAAKAAALSAAAAAALFEQANRARRSGRLEQAAELYADLQTSFGKSAEARLSYALAARMWLDSGNAFAAHGGFEHYLASGDRALREEAMAGRALSLERLGRSAAAHQAFAELLREYPYSSYAHLAKKRLGQD